MISRGDITEEEAHGNDMADRAADEGRKLHHRGSELLSNLYAQRSDHYVKLIKQVHRLILKVWEGHMQLLRTCLRWSPG